MVFLQDQDHGYKSEIIFAHHYIYSIVKIPLIMHYITYKVAKFEVLHTLSTNNWHNKIGYHIVAMVLIQNYCMAIFMFLKDHPNDLLGTNTKDQEEITLEFLADSRKCGTYTVLSD